MSTEGSSEAYRPGGPLSPPLSGPSPSVSCEPLSADEPEPAPPQAPPEPSDGQLRESAERIAAYLERIEGALERIAEHMRLEQREQQIREFSLSHLLGGVALVVAAAAMLGAVLALLQEAANWRLATVALLAATPMQILALTLFTLSRRR